MNVYYLCLEIVVPVVEDVKSKTDLLATTYCFRSFDSHEERSRGVVLHTH